MKIFEVGVGDPWQSRTSQYIGSDIECYLFEPNPECFEQLNNAFSKYPNFKLFNFALGDENKTVNFFLVKGGSSFFEGVKSPEMNHNPNSENERQKIEIPVRDIRDFDDGKIDILLLDTEGTEYPIIKNLISRPKKIIVEMYSFGVKYKNPFFDEIMTWMKDNNYKIVSEHEDFIFELI